MPSHLHRPSPVQDAPAPALAPQSVAPTDLSYGAMGALGMQGTQGNSAVAAAIGANKKTTPTVDPVAEDRKKAATELASRFEIVKDDAKGVRAPNQVTQAEYDKLCATYSDIRLGRGDLTIDASNLKGQKAQDAYKSGAMNDIASLLQTSAGRAEISQLSNNATQKDAKGNPVHHHTTLTPLLQANGQLDKTNGYAAPNGSGGDASFDRSGKMIPGKGTDVTINYNPGVNVGDAYKEYQKANPWLAGFRSDVILMHEGKHAINMTSGTVDERNIQSTDNAKNTRDPKMRQDAQSGIQRVEHQAVGLGMYANDTMTENAYRAERRQIGDKGGTAAQAGDSTMVQRTSYTPSASAAAVGPPA